MDHSNILTALDSHLTTGTITCLTIWKALSRHSQLVLKVELPGQSSQLEIMLASSAESGALRKQIDGERGTKVIGIMWGGEIEPGSRARAMGKEETL